MAELAKKLDAPQYHRAIKLRGYNSAVTVFQAVSAADAAKVLKRVNPEWSKADHVDLAKKHADEAAIQDREWLRLVNEASMEKFGRPYRITDYHISGIARDEFSDEKKGAMRFAAHAATAHATLSRAHASAARGW